MKIILKAENKQEQEQLGAKEIGYKKVTDYYLAVRWIEADVLKKEDSRSFGDLNWVLEKLYTAKLYLENLDMKTKLNNLENLLNDMKE